MGNFAYLCSVKTERIWHKQGFLPTFRTSLRLYCLRMSDSVLIVGNGGEKNTKTYEESAELNGYVISLQKLDELLKQEIASGSVVIEKANIVGADEKLFDL